MFRGIWRDRVHAGQSLAKTRTFMPLTMTQDFKLGFRMLLKYPGLTLAGGLALTIAIGVGAGWYQTWGNILSPTIPLPEGDRLVLVQTRNTLANQAESRVCA